MVAKFVALRQVAADVPEFLQVVRLVSLGRLNSERRVATGAATASDEIFALHLVGQREESLRFLLGAVDQLVRNAVIGDDREAIFLKAVAELLRKALGIAVGVLQGDGRDGVSGDRSHGTLYYCDAERVSASNSPSALISINADAEDSGKHQRRQRSAT